MLKLLIVDDEKTTRDGLKEYIPWSELDIDVVETAKNGIVALKLADEIKPDILLTDVRMPKMDGIELASNIKNRFPDCKIIFLSGYSDKEYLKSAINLKAVSYVEKPLKIAQVKTAINEAVSLCNMENRKKVEDEKRNRQLIKSEPYIRQEMALELIKGNFNLNTYLEKYPDYHSITDEACGFTSACVLLNWRSDIACNAKNAVKRKILQSLSGLVSEAGLLIGFNEDGKLILIICGVDAASCPNPENKVIASLAGILGDISEGLYTFSIGLGHPVVRATELHYSYAAALSAVKNQFYEGIGKIFYLNALRGESFAIDKTVYHDFKCYLAKENPEAAIDLVKVVVNEACLVKDNNIDHVKDSFFQFLMIINEFADKRLLVGSRDLGEKKFIWQEIDAIKTLHELAEFVVSNLEAVFSSLDGKNTYKAKIYEIEKYVRCHYYKHGLTIKDIAECVYLSETYLCAFFKKITGKTLNEFITEVRMDRAKELMMDIHLKFYEISDSVGFTNVNYFSTLFKKHTGCTPSEFREKIHAC